MTNHDAVTGAQDALNHLGAGPFDPRLLAHILDTNPSLAADGAKWGWTDTEVRDGVYRAVACRLLGLTEHEYRHTAAADEAGLDREVRAAHDRWVAAHPENPTASTDSNNTPHRPGALDLRHLAIIFKTGADAADRLNDGPLTAALSAMSEAAAGLHLNAHGVWNVETKFAEIADRLR